LAKLKIIASWTKLIGRRTQLKEKTMAEMSIIEVAIGLVFAYVLFSLLCTFINELIARLFSLRSENLERGLEQLLADSEKVKKTLWKKVVHLTKRLILNISDISSGNLAQEVMNHHLIKGSTINQKRPSYIASETFALVLIDLIDKKSNGAAKAAKSSKEIKNAIDKAKLPIKFKESIIGLIDNVDTTINDLRHNLQAWFDSSMDRVSGWYKRQLQVISFVVALLLVVSLNVDTIAIGQALWQNPVLREKIADEAAVAVEACKSEENPENCSFLKESEKTRERLKKFPIGWAKSLELRQVNWLWWLFIKIIGWLITAVAISFGAPFWFNVLDKLNSIRSAGIKPKTVYENSSALFFDDSGNLHL
jgi:hypothetical protein